MKKLLFALIIIFVGIGAYFYFTRPASAPSGDIVGTTENLPSGDSEEEKRYAVVPNESKAQFSLYEMLRGERTHVVGTTGDITGQVAIDTSTPAEMRIGEIKINARTLKTDSDQRNGAIANLILKSGDSSNEYIVFTPTYINGVPNSIEEGSEFSFTVTGDLLISGTTQSVTFDATGMLAGDTFSGTAESDIEYKNFGLSIPNIPFVADVDETVHLKVTFVAKEV